MIRSDFKQIKYMRIIFFFLDKRELFDFNKVINNLITNLCLHNVSIHKSARKNLAKITESRSHAIS